MRRISDGAEISSVGVEGVEGIRSHTVGAISSKPGMTSCGVLVLTIVDGSEKVVIVGQNEFTWL